MAGIRALRKIQIGQEATAGTPVAATTLWRGLGGMPDDQRTVVFPDEDIGYLSGTDRQYQPKLMGQASFDDTPATFEQLPHILEAGIRTVTATSDGSGRVRVYDLATTAPATIKTYTIEAGDNTAAERMEYSFVQDFSLSGTAGEAWNIGATWQGRQWTPTTFTGALTPPAVEEALFGRTSLYIAASTDPIASTDLVSQTLLAATLQVNTGWQPVFTANGQLYFDFAKQTAPEVTLQVTFQHNASAVAEKSAWRAGTPRKIRLTVPGRALATPGITYATKLIQIDLAGKWESFDVLGEQDGNDIVTATFRARYNADANYAAQIIVVNEIASL